MIRRVAFKKAIVAGVLGALAWEIAVRGLLAIGVPMFDLVYTLGTMVLGDGSSVWQWWPAGIIMHALVGSIWAIFYAYFVWSLFEYPPAVQGMIFSLLPAVLAGLIMVPQMDHMYWKLLDPKIHENGFFAIGLGWTGPFTIILGHLLYGAVMGSFYTRPVGYAVGGRAATYG